MSSKEFSSMTLDRHSAAQKLGVSVVTLDRMVAKRRIGHVRIGRRVLFTDEMLSEYIARNTMNPRER